MTQAAPRSTSGSPINRRVAEPASFAGLQPSLRVLGERISFKVPEAPGQTFSPTVVAFDDSTSMVWRLNRWPLLVSERTYRLSVGPHGSTEFTIDEVFQGLLLPLIAKSLPDFGAMFERTATDLKATAEAATPT